jgi:hypothetical protein
MRKAAGIILIVWGTAGFAQGLVDLLLQGSRVTPWEVVILVLLVLTVVGGISAIRMRAYWWAISGAGVLVIAGIISAVLQWQYSLFLTPVINHAMRVLMAAAAGCAYGIPGLLALIFLAKRKGEFQSGLDFPWSLSHSCLDGG